MNDEKPPITFKGIPIQFDPRLPKNRVVLKGRRGEEVVIELGEAEDGK